MEIRNALQSLSSEIKDLAQQPKDSFFTELSQSLFNSTALELNRLSIFKLSYEQGSFELWFSPSDDDLAQAVQKVYETTDLLKLSSNSLLSQAAEQKQSVYVPDSASESDWVFLEEHPNRASLTCPIFVKDELWGMAEFQSYQPNAFDDHIMIFLEDVVSSMSSVIANEMAEPEKELQLA